MGEEWRGGDGRWEWEEMKVGGQWVERRGWEVGMGGDESGRSVGGEEGKEGKGRRG